MRDGLIKVTHLAKYGGSNKQWFMVEKGKAAYQCSESYPQEFKYFPPSMDVSEDYWVNRQRLELSIPLEYLK